MGSCRIKGIFLINRSIMIKRAIFLGLLGLFTFTSVHAQEHEFAIPLEASDGANRDTLYFGIHPDATAGNDAGLDTAAPPPPPSGAFDMVLENESGERFFTDIRDTSVTGKTYVVTYAAESGEGPVTFSWDAATLEGEGTFEINRTVAGTEVLSLDMTDQSSLDLSNTDLDANAGEFSILVTPNYAPTLENPIPDTTVNANSSAFSVDLSAVFDDSQGDTMSFTASSSNSGAVTASVENASLSVESVAEGTATITVSATDSLGKTTQESFTVEVTPGLAVTRSLNDTTIVNGDVIPDINISDNFDDGIAPLSFSASSSDDGVLQASISDGSLSYEATGSGQATVTVTATDDIGATASFDFTVNVNAQLSAANSFNDLELNIGTESDAFHLPDYFEGGIGSYTFAWTSSDSSVATASIADSDLTVTAHDNGTATLNVTVTDERGESFTQSFEVTVVIPTVTVSYPAQLSGSLNSTQTVAVSVGDLPNMDISSFDFGFHFDSSLLSISESDIQLGDGLSGSVNASVTGDDSVLVSYSGDMIEADETLFTMEVTFDSEGQNTEGFEVSRGQLQSPEVPLEPELPRTIAVYSGALRAVGSVPDYSRTDEGPAIEIDPDTIFAAGVPPVEFSSSLTNADPLSVSRENDNFVLTPAAPGTTQVTLTATDDQGATAEQQFMVYIESSNVPPPTTAIHEPVHQLTVDIDGEPSEMFTIRWDLVTDQDGDLVTYTYQLALSDNFGSGQMLLEVSHQDSNHTAFSYSTLDSLFEEEGVNVGDTLTAYHRVNTSDQVDMTTGDVNEVDLVRGRVAHRVAVQFIHNSPQFDSVDVYVHDTAEAEYEELVFREATAFREIARGSNVPIYLLAADGDPSDELIVEADIDTGSAYQVIVNGRNDPQVHVNDGRLSSHSGNTIRASAVHALSTMLSGTDFRLLNNADAGVVGTFGTNMQFGDFSSYMTFDPMQVLFESTDRDRRFRFDLANAGGEALTFVTVPVADSSNNATFTVRAYDAAGASYDPVEITPIDEDEPNRELPEKIVLKGNRPNPFNPVTTIGFSVPEATKVTLKVYNMLGRQMTTLVDRKVSAGKHEVTFDAEEMTSGVYLYRLQTPDQTKTRKMLLMK